MAQEVDCTICFSKRKTDCFRYLVMLTPRSVPLIFQRLFCLESFGFTSLWFLCSLFNAGFVFLSICHCIKSLFVLVTDFIQSFIVPSMCPLSSSPVSFPLLTLFMCLYPLVFLFLISRFFFEVIFSFVWFQFNLVKQFFHQPVIKVSVCFTDSASWYSHFIKHDKCIVYVQRNSTAR